MSHSSRSRLLFLFSTPMKWRMFSCFMPFTLNISYSFCQDSLSYTRAESGTQVLFMWSLPLRRITNWFNLRCQTSTFKSPHLRGCNLQQPYLDGEDLHSHVVAQQLGLPHAPEAPPGFQSRSAARVCVPQWETKVWDRDPAEQQKKDIVILYFFSEH